jgi:hypothetical protein
MDQTTETEERMYVSWTNATAERRRKLATYFEMIIYFSLFSLAYLRSLLELRSHETFDPIAILTSPFLLITGFICILAIFFLLLTGWSPLVNIAVSGNLGRLVKKPSEFISVLGDSIIKTDGPAAPRRRHEASDDAELNFLNYLARSQEAARTAQRRPNALLFFGTFVALIGLVFFVITLPGSRYGIFLPGEAGLITSVDAWATAMQLLPRLLMLVFIQVLAGFFLRQYRTSMEDFRYYESVLRQREAQLLSYILRKQTGDKKSILAFANEIMKDHQVGLLLKGQTTASLEAQRLANNEISTLYEKFANLIASAKEKPPSLKKASSQGGAE